MIVTTALTEPVASLWISRDAQRAIRFAAEGGVSARNPDAEAHRRVATVTDAATGCSVAVVTGADLQAHTAYLPVDGPVSVTPAMLHKLRRRPAAADLLMLLKHALGVSEQITLALEP